MSRAGSLSEFAWCAMTLEQAPPLSTGGMELQVPEGLSIAFLLQRMSPDYGDEGGTYTGR